MAVLTVEQILSGSTLGLVSGLSDLLVLDIGGRTVLYGLSRTENRLVEIDVAADGTLGFVDAMSVQGVFPAGSEPLLGHVETASGGTRLTLAGLPVADGQSVSLSASGGLLAQQSMPVGQLVAPVGISLPGTAALLSGKIGGGVNLFVDEGAGFGWSAGLNDTAERYLADVAASVTFEQSGTHFAATVSATEDGLNVVAVTSGNIAQSGALGTAEGMPVNLPSDLAAVQRLGETLLLIAGLGTNSVSVARVEAGVPILADHILDAEDTRFQGASAIDAVTYGDFAFVAVGGAEGGISLLTALPGGRLVHLASLADDESTTLYRLSSVEMVVTGSALQLYGASFWEAGITRLSYDLSTLGVVEVADGSGAAVAGTNADDQLIGSSVGETLSGEAGADILFDGAGSDILTGGTGADLFVMAADGLPDTVTDFERGVDRFDLSAFDFLYQASQLGVTPTADGAILTHGNEVITVVTADAQPLTAAELTNADILNVDRPPFLSVGQTLSGGPGIDILNGGAGADTITGLGGDDSLNGGFGDDSLAGGAGLDLLLGDAGADTLSGDANADTLVGGTGDDLLLGGDGGDVLYGDDWPGA